MENSIGSEGRVVFCPDSPPSDPQSEPVLIVGQVENLRSVGYEAVKHKLGDRVSAEVYKSALASLHQTTPDSVSLYINVAMLASLPSKCSRHNSTARPYSLASIVKSASSGVSETIVVVCPFVDVLASACAIARSYPLYSKKSSGKTPQLVRVEFIITDGNGDAVDYDALNIIGSAVRNAARIVDMPCNEMNTNTFIQEIKRVAYECDLELTVIQGEELRVRGMNGIYSVGRSAENGPALVAVKYKSNKEGGPVMAWVGKGIVYDTGGLSIKTKALMPGMKRDCAGAAGILGALCVAARLGLSSCSELHAIFCLAENSVGPKATRPDDVETLYSGKSVEINNTDAEGRLVLADGVVYAARDLKADFIVDMATLTGAQGIATGKYHAALLTNSAEIEAEAVEISRIAGDLIYPIPFSPELHFSEFTSAVADMKNSVADRANAQSSCAGLFIMAHLGFDFPGAWMHIDMASPAYCNERATGYGVALLTLLFGKYSDNDMIRKLYELAEAAFKK
ncbi:probable aminopeptidase NPEPL1 [Cimex lectularius]|uniref:Cytosol aminopeptidase domain-containing protein n=1 Tax=Cimex lectularius TaxID=79782 RepID=A0A8I6TDL4_CIMLE|nr:probable aminopeptidase NPEPL1 [Cimex lectularius]